jgi:hypothetical protein
MSLKPLLAFYGHHKCATMWFNQILSSACSKLGLNFDAVYDSRDFGGDLQAYVSEKRIDFISHGNAELEHVKSLGTHLGFHIIRDPRDIVVSAYFSHLRSHSTEKWPELIRYREKLQSVSKEEGLQMEIENRANEFRHMSTWDYDQDHILELKFEEVVTYSFENLLQIFDHLQLLGRTNHKWPERAKYLLLDLIDYVVRAPASRFCKKIKPETLCGAEILAIAWRNRFEARTAGRNVGEENTTSHFRKGQPGDWKNHFTEEHKKFFNKLYPTLLIDLGYESSESW